MSFSQTDHSGEVSSISVLSTMEKNTFTSQQLAFSFCGTYSNFLLARSESIGKDEDLGFGI